MEGHEPICPAPCCVLHKHKRVHCICITGEVGDGSALFVSIETLARCNSMPTFSLLVNGRAHPTADASMCRQIALLLEPPGEGGSQELFISWQASSAFPPDPFYREMLPPSTSLSSR